MAGAVRSAVEVTPGVLSVLVKPCPFCGRQRSFLLDKDDYEAWQAGAKIQDAMPELLPDDRETLMSGACGPCFDRAYA